MFKFLFLLSSFFLASLFTKTFFTVLFMSERSFVFEVIIFRIVGLLYLIRCLIRNLNFSEQLVIDFKFS